MCECGCTSNNEYYVLPARSGLVYLLTFTAACTSCDAPSGISIERFKSRKAIAKAYCLDALDLLPFEKWADSEGCAIITGHRKHEFVKALNNGLIGVDSNLYGDDTSSELDETAAETILEEMYEDSTVKPFIVGSKAMPSSRARP